MTNRAKFTIQRAPNGLGRVMCVRCRAWERLGPISEYPSKATRQEALEWANAHLAETHPLIVAES